MKDKQNDAQTIDYSKVKSTSGLITLLQENRKHILALWVDKVRDVFGEPASTTDEQLTDHMLYIIDALIVELSAFKTDVTKSKSIEQGDMLYKDGFIEDRLDGGQLHGRQRAGITAYNADKIYWEYVLLRKTIVEFAQQHRVLDIDHLEIITCVIESCSRDSMQIFAKTIQKVQSKLLGSIVHDVRSPLNAISMMGEFIAMDIDPTKSLMFAQKIVNSTTRISKMLEDMLLTLSVEAGQGLELKFEKHNLNFFLSAVALEAQVIHGTRLKLMLPEKNIIAVLDETVFKRVFENLISNAFKYGDDLTDVTVTATESDDHIMMDVHNFGLPIDIANRNRIFLFMERIKDQNKIQHKSWGIGLAYVKAAVEGHGGKVILSSEASSGTRFSVKLPKNIIQQGRTATVPI
jgi:signal transduction histidine kinase